MPVPCCFDHCSFVGSFKIKMCETFNFGFLFKDCFVYSGFLDVFFLLMHPKFSLTLCNSDNILYWLCNQRALCNQRGICCLHPNFSVLAKDFRLLEKTPGFSWLISSESAGVGVPILAGWLPPHISMDWYRNHTFWLRISDTCALTGSQQPSLCLSPS